MTIEDKKAIAWAAAETAVKSKLKAPSTAKFESYKKDKVEHVEDDTFKIESYVDAQNGFGAMIRNNFIVTIEFDFEDESFTVLDLQIR